MEHYTGQYWYWSLRIVYITLVTRFSALNTAQILCVIPCRKENSEIQLQLLQSQNVWKLYVKIIQIQSRFPLINNFSRPGFPPAKKPQIFFFLFLRKKKSFFKKTWQPKSNLADVAGSPNSLKRKGRGLRKQYFNLDILNCNFSI